MTTTAHTVGRTIPHASPRSVPIRAHAHGCTGRADPLSKRPADRSRIAPCPRPAKGGGSELTDLLPHVAWVRFERGDLWVRATVESAAKRQLSYRFHMPGAPTHAGRDSLLHHRLNRLAAPDAGRWSLGLGHGQ